MTSGILELMMFGDGALSFQEFIMNEPLPLARIQDAIFEFLRGRDDAVMFGAQAVNAYVKEWRMTEDVDILSTRGPELAEELRKFLNERFHIAVRTRKIRGGIGYRVYQIQKPENRHLADVRPVAEFPPSRRINGILVPNPEQVVANKVRAYAQRLGSPKSFTDRRDLAVLLLTFPDLKVSDGAVRERLVADGAGTNAYEAWDEIVRQPIVIQNEDDKF